MAAQRRAQDIDQWRPEDSSDSAPKRTGDRNKVQRSEPRASSPPPRAARDSSRHRTHDSDARPSTRHGRGRSHDRTVSRERARRRSRGESGEERARGSKRGSSADRASHSHRHHHHHHHHQHHSHRDTSPSSKRYRSRSPSPRGSVRRAKRQRSRTPVRSRSRPRRAGSTHRPLSRAVSPRLDQPDRDRAPPRHSPDTYIPLPSKRRRSPSVESHYRAAGYRARRRSISSDRRSRRDLSPRRPDRRRNSPLQGPRERPPIDRFPRDRTRSRSRAPHSHRSRSPLRRRSPAPARRSPASNSRHTRVSPHGSRSPLPPGRRRVFRSRSPVSTTRSKLEKEVELDGEVGAKTLTSRRGSPAPVSKHDPVTSRNKSDEADMRGAYHYQGRGGPAFQQSPPYGAHNQYPPQSQSPYTGTRGSWNGQAYSNQG